MAKLNKIYWKARIVLLALRWIPQVNIGDYVWYRGEKYIVHNGVRYGEWRLDETKLPDDGWVPRSDCRKVWTWENIKWSFQHGYRFYMNSWFDIWVHQGIKPWMKGCNIWPWPRRNHTDRRPNA